jgi:hypothetical protein
MKYHLVFERSASCEHSDEKECFACFRAGMVSYFGSEEAFEGVWRKGWAVQEKEIESFTIHYGEES